MKIHGIYNAQILTPERVIENGSVLLDGNGRIAQILPTPDLSLPGPVINADGLTLAPGFIDLQLNGGFGCDFTTDPETIWDVAASLPQYGVTRFLPTLIAAPLDAYRQAQAVLAAGPPAGFKGAVPVGLHFEGPFLNPGKKGAHDPAHLRLPDLAAIDDWSPENGVRLVTLAPELPGATAIIEALTRRGVVVSAGHSLATFAEAQMGFASGVHYGTHLFNAMSGIHHRQPGLAGALLADERVTIGLIADGVHVHPALVKLVWQVAAGRLNLVTDAMAALGMPPGTYQLGEKKVTVREESGSGLNPQVSCLTVRLDDGTLAGSVLSLDTAVRNLIQFTGCTLPEAANTVSFQPADLLNLNTGKIQSGTAADFVLLDSNLAVVQTVVASEVVFTADHHGTPESHK